MDKSVTITRGMLSTTSVPRLREGASIKAFHLLYPLLMESSNEAAHALSLPVGEKYFVSLMNKKAQALGMANTKFVDSAGKKAENVSTVRDLFALARYLYHNRSFVFDITAGDVNEAVYGVAPFGKLENFNVGADEPTFVGGKIGKTNAAKQTALSVFMINHKGEERPVVFIVLGSENSENDIAALQGYIRTTYK